MGELTDNKRAFFMRARHYTGQEGTKPGCTAHGENTINSSVDPILVMLKKNNSVNFWVVFEVKCLYI